ncbi:MAG: S-adenosylmethionine:tRNA ribosyltransferase-isomerase [Acidimicrobiales bacterium]
MTTRSLDRPPVALADRAIRRNETALANDAGPGPIPSWPPATLDLPFALEERHLATAPPEATGQARDAGRLLVSQGSEAPVHARFTNLAAYLDPGDLVVVNTSGTRNAAIDGRTEDGMAIVVHVSTELPGSLWMVEPRSRTVNGSTRPLALEPRTTSVALAGGGKLSLLRPAPGSERLWVALVDSDANLLDLLSEHGRPIRYPYVDRDWPLDAYQTVFANERRSAEMASAARPFSDAVVTSLVRRGVALARITLHTGVSSLEGHERPYAEQFEVPAETATAVDATHAAGHRVVAVGTTVVRALETAVDEHGRLHPAHGWTETVITPDRPVRAVDGLVTGWHEPGASHLAMLEAVAGREPLLQAYVAAWEAGYRWHEFGDSHLLLPHPRTR